MKRISLIDWFLIVLIAVMGVWTGMRIIHVNKLKTIYAGLVAQTGELPPTAPEELAVMRIPTDDPLYFAWRIRLPVNRKYLLKTTTSTGSSSSSWINDVELFLRLRLRVKKDVVEVYFASDSGQTIMSFTPKNPEMIKGLQSNDLRSVIKTITDNEIIVKSSEDQTMELMRIVLPSDAASPADQTSSNSDSSDNDPIFRVFLEPEP